MTNKTRVTVYHNPRCSKSRQTLGILNSRQDCEVEVVQYLKSPPSTRQLKDILEKLKLSARDLLRSNEAPYKSENLAAPELTEDELIAAMIEHPILMQRPIVVSETTAVIGRPPEQVLTIL